MHYRWWCNTHNSTAVMSVWINFLRGNFLFFLCRINSRPIDRPRNSFRPGRKKPLSIAVFVFDVSGNNDVNVRRKKKRFYLSFFLIRDICVTLCRRNFFPRSHPCCRCSKRFITVNARNVVGLHFASPKLRSQNSNAPRPTGRRTLQYVIQMAARL